jgi:hypothetical protein
MAIDKSYEPKSPEPGLLDSLYHSANALLVDSPVADVDNTKYSDSIGVDSAHKRGPQDGPID